MQRTDEPPLIQTVGSKVIMIEKAIAEIRDALDLKQANAAGGC